MRAETDTQQAGSWWDFRSHAWDEEASVTITKERTPQAKDRSKASEWLAWD